MKLGLVKSSVCVAAVSLLAACAPFGKQSPLDETTAYPLPQGQSAATAQDGWWMKLKDKKLNNFDCFRHSDVYQSACRQGKV